MRKLVKIYYNRIVSDTTTVLVTIAFAILMAMRLVDIIANHRGCISSFDYIQSSNIETYAMMTILLAALSFGKSIHSKNVAYSIFAGYRRKTIFIAYVMAGSCMLAIMLAVSVMISVLCGAFYGFEATEFLFYLMIKMVMLFIGLVNVMVLNMILSTLLSSVMNSIVLSFVVFLSFELLYGAKEIAKSFMGINMFAFSLFDICNNLGIKSFRFDIAGGYLAINIVTFFVLMSVGIRRFDRMELSRNVDISRDI